MSKTENEQKGRLLEAVVAALYTSPEVTVRRNVLYPVSDGRSKAPEIDVLISGNVAGYLVQFAIECKNYTKKPIGPDLINAFLGKLDDVGIPTQQGIFITTTRFTDGAIKRAAKTGLKLLVLNGLSDDRLSPLLIDAIRSIAFLVPEIREIRTQDYTGKLQAFETLLFYNDEGVAKSSVVDIVYELWQQGSIEHTVGMHEIKIGVPEGLRPAGSISTEDLTTTVIVRVYASVVNIMGKASHYKLIDPETHRVQKEYIEANFPVTAERYPLNVFYSESELQGFWNARKTDFNITQEKIKIPRVKFGFIFWPPSERVQQKFNAFIQEQSDVMKALAEHNPFKGIEGDDLAAAWEK